MHRSLLSLPLFYTLPRPASSAPPLPLPPFSFTTRHAHEQPPPVDRWLPRPRLAGSSRSFPIAPLRALLCSTHLASSWTVLVVAVVLPAAAAPEEFSADGGRGTGRARRVVFRRCAAAAAAARPARQEEACPARHARSRRGGDRAVAQDADGDQPVRVRDLQQGVPAGPEPAAAPPGTQPAVEAPAAERQGGPEAGLRLPRAHLRPPRQVARPRRPHRHQEALLPQARREEVEVRKVLQEVRRAVRLEGAHQDLRLPRVPLRLRHPLLQEGQLHHPPRLLRRAGRGRQGARAAAGGRDLRGRWWSARAAATTTSRTGATATAAAAAGPCTRAATRGARAGDQRRARARRPVRAAPGAKDAVPAFGQRRQRQCQHQQRLGQLAEPPRQHVRAVLRGPAAAVPGACKQAAVAVPGHRRLVLPLLGPCSRPASAAAAVGFPVAAHVRHGLAPEGRADGRLLVQLLVPPRAGPRHLVLVLAGVDVVGSAAASAPPPSPSPGGRHADAVPGRGVAAAVALASGAGAGPDDVGRARPRAAVRLDRRLAGADDGPVVAVQRQASHGGFPGPGNEPDGRGHEQGVLRVRATDGRRGGHGRERHRRRRRGVRRGGPWSSAEAMGEEPE